MAGFVAGTVGARAVLIGGGLTLAGTGLVWAMVTRWTLAGTRPDDAPLVDGVAETAQ